MAPAPAVAVLSPVSLASTGHYFPIAPGVQSSAVHCALCTVQSSAVPCHASSEHKEPCHNSTRSSKQPRQAKNVTLSCQSKRSYRCTRDPPGPKSPVLTPDRVNLRFLRQGFPVMFSHHFIQHCSFHVMLSCRSDRHVLM